MCFSQGEWRGLGTRTQGLEVEREIIKRPPSNASRTGLVIINCPHFITSIHLSPGLQNGFLPITSVF